MRQEYLFIKDEHFVDLSKKDFIRIIKDSKSDSQREVKATKNIVKYNDQLWMVLLEMDGENEDVARYMCEFHTEMMEKYMPTVIKDDVSSYYNKKLYPLVNEFERELRRFLYTKVSFAENPNLNKAIERLDTLTLGQIHNNLFCDDAFIAKAKSFASNGKYSKEEIIAKISEFEENTKWDIIVGDDSLKKIKMDFLLLKEYRNDVMHAHAMTTERYNMIKKCFKEANNALVSATDSILNIARKDSGDSNLIKSAKILVDIMSEWSLKIDQSAIANAISSMALPKYEISSEFLEMLAILSNSIKSNIDDEMGHSLLI